MDDKKNKYEGFDVVDLVLNDDFKQLVLGDEGHQATENLINKFPQHRENIELASKILLGIQTKKQAHPLHKKYELWMRICGNQRRSGRLNVLRYAAVLLLLVSLGAGTLFRMNHKPAITEFAQTRQTDFNQSRLILNDGKDVAVASSEPLVEYMDDGKSVVLNDSVRYEQSLVGFNQMIVPYGKRSRINLADGTKVRMNSGSRLVYPPQFNGKEREVYLEGEAYFEVAKNPDKPFHVRTDEFKVEVIGTTFNVQAYSKENLYNTVLVEGEVKLTLNNRILSGTVVMAPNQIASLTNDHSNFKLQKTGNIQNHISWIDGYLDFSNERLDVLLKRVSSYYNIKIAIEELDSQLRIKGKLDLKDDPERLLDGITAIAKLKYQKVGDDSYVLYK